MCQAAITTIHAARLTGGRSRKASRRRSQCSRASGRSTNLGRRKNRSGPRSATRTSAGAASPIRTCWSMWPERRYESPTASRGETSASVPSAIASRKRKARDQLAWSARPRRRSRTTACAKSSSATPAPMRTGGDGSHAEPSPERPSITSALREDLGRAVASLESYLVRPRRPARAVVEIDEEVAVDLHPAVGVAVHAQEPGAQPRVELVVPGRIERVRHVEPATVERELEHLRPAVELAPGVARLAKQAAEPEPAGQLRVGRVGDVVPAQVAVEPVREVEEAVVHRDEQVGDESGHGERPALELDALDRDHLVGGPAAVVAAEAPHRAREGGADEALLRVRVVQPAHFQWDQPGLTEVER